MYPGPAAPALADWKLAGDSRQPVKPPLSIMGGSRLQHERYREKSSAPSHSAGGPGPRHEILVAWRRRTRASFHSARAGAGDGVSEYSPLTTYPADGDGMSEHPPLTTCLAGGDGMSEHPPLTTCPAGGDGVSEHPPLTTCPAGGDGVSEHPPLTTCPAGGDGVSEHPPLTICPAGGDGVSEHPPLTPVRGETAHTERQSHSVRETARRRLSSDEDGAQTSDVGVGIVYDRISHKFYGKTA